MTDASTLIGMIAGFCTTAAFVPQVISVWRTRHARDISLAMYLILLAGREDIYDAVHRLRSVVGVHGREDEMPRFGSA